jgi:UDP-N-acetylmuramoylalanine-D-glutamate ligase
VEPISKVVAVAEDHIDYHVNDVEYVENYF